MIRLPLYPYQEPAVKQFLDRGNLLCAMEMGTGKTAIGIHAAEQIGGLCLVVCPANLRIQWGQQIDKFCDSQFVIVPGTPLKKRREAYRKIRETSSKFVIMSYETVVNDPADVRKLNPSMVILDEASAIKSFRAKRTKKVKQLLKAPHRLALTGTPIENRPDELYSIMQWVDPNVLGRWDLFEQTYIERDFFGSVKRYKNLPVLHKRVSEAQFRAKRTDPDVKPYLPDEDHGAWFVKMSPQMAKAYRVMAADMLKELDNVSPSGHFDPFAWYTGAPGMEKFGPIGGMMISMKMLLDHPDLVILSGQRYREDKGGSEYCYNFWQSDVLDDVETSSKLEFLAEEVNTILETSDENRVIVFTQFRKMVPFIEEALGVPCAQYHGDMSTAQKTDAIEDFKTKKRVLISTHAGAYGTDMYMANYLIQYDVPDAYGKYAQITGRHVRAASEFKKVFVRDIITEGTIEARNYQRVKFKKQVADAVVDNDHQDESGAIENEVESLRACLEEFLNGKWT